jgi:hypothetical protein
MTTGWMGWQLDFTSHLHLLLEARSAWKRLTPRRLGVTRSSRLSTTRSWGYRFIRTCTHLHAHIHTHTYIYIKIWVCCTGNITTDWLFCAGNITTEWIICTGEFFWTDYFVLEYPYWLNILYWNINANWLFCTGISLLPEYFVLECSFGLIIWYWNITYDWIFYWNILFCTGNITTDCVFCSWKHHHWLNILYWNIPLDWLFGTGISISLPTEYFTEIHYFVLKITLLTAYFALGNIITDWIFCTGIFLWTDYLVMEYPR